jgi:hypothetical protein
MRREQRKKRNPGRLGLPGFWFVGRARRPSDERSKSTQVANEALFRAVFMMGVIISPVR